MGKRLTEEERAKRALREWQAMTPARRLAFRLEGNPVPFGCAIDDPVFTYGEERWRRRLKLAHTMLAKSQAAEARAAKRVASWERKIRHAENWLSRCSSSGC
jgi:hypothetical protein